MPRKVYPKIVPVRDEFFGRLEDGIAAQAGEPEDAETFKQAWEGETAPAPKLQMRMERQEPVDKDGRS